MSFIPEGTPFTSLPNSLRGRLKPNQLAVLWTLQSYHPNIWPSYSRVAGDTRMSSRQVMRVVDELQAMGLLDKVGRRTSKGQTSNVYRVTVWKTMTLEPSSDPGCHPVAEPLQDDKTPVVTPCDSQSPYDSQSPPPMTDSHPPYDSQSPEEEQRIKNKKELKPPTYYVSSPPRGATHTQGNRSTVPSAAVPEPFAGGTLASLPQPQHAAEPDRIAPSPPKPRIKAFVPTTEDIPPALLPVEAPLKAFWQDKAGQRTQQAWNCLTAALERIWRHPDGGTAAVREQLDNAIQSGWRSITFANWLKYGQTALAPAGNARRGSANMDAARAAIAMYDQRGIA
jgi:hypothetical protein